MDDLALIEPHLAAQGITVPPAAWERIGRYVSLLERWNRRINLTAHRTRRDLVVRHVLDCLMLERLPAPAGPCRVADLGSGAGLPGLLLALLHPDWQVTSVERAGKKVAFQQVAAQELGLANFTPLRADVRALAAGEGRGAYDVVVARAFAALGELLAVAAGLLRPGGSCWAMKGPRLATEQAAVPADVRAAFAPEVATFPYRFAELDLGGVVAVYRRASGPEETAGDAPRA